MSLALDEAESLAGRLSDILRPLCDRLLVAGSIRRRQPRVGDIDLVAESKTLIRPSTIYSILEGRTEHVATTPLLPDYVRQLLAGGLLKARVKKDGKTMVGDGIACVLFEGVPVDLYYATPNTWGGLVLVRTGSKAHNIGMVSRAKRRGWFLHADGTGLFDAREGGRRIDDGTEASFFDRLGMAYREPTDRETWVEP